MADVIDPLVFGRRLRDLRRRRGLTLDELGAIVDRPASYLSQVENGRKEPRLSLVAALATALACRLADLVDQTPPTRRAELEVALVRAQEDPRYRALRLPQLRPSARLGDTAIEHLLALFEAVRHTDADARAPGGFGARAANAALREEMRRRDNYFEEIEQAAAPALAAVGYPGTGAVPERLLTEIAAYFGFSILQARDLPPTARSISDLNDRVIYVAQRDATGGMRSTRSLVAQTLGHFALGHREPSDFDHYVRQRVEANYFAGALLAPEAAVGAVLTEAKAHGDVSVEDIGEIFYVSYEMAAHRLTNLVTRHLGIPTHFLRTDQSGEVWKAYENDGVPIPSDADGTIEGQRLCRFWGARQAFESEDAYALHCQYTETPEGTFWSASHLELEHELGDAITFGCREEDARYFRGSETVHRAVSRCPDPTCCKAPPPDQRRRWEGAVWTSARDQSRFVSGLPSDAVAFSAHPGVDLGDVYAFLDRHGNPQRR